MRFALFFIFAFVHCQFGPSFISINTTGALRLDGDVAVIGGTFEANGKTDLRGPVNVGGLLIAQVHHFYLFHYFNFTQLEKYFF